ncbi:hypothetical protein H8E77_00880 [bacterium]|nr:hypothetical protein [bacterium]
MLRENVQNIIVITANAAGGKPKPERNPEVLGNALGCKKPDFLCLQELVVCKGGGIPDEDTLDELCIIGGLQDYQPFFLPSVDTERNPCPQIVQGTNKEGKWYRTDSSFKGRDYAAQGNGFLIRNDWEVVDLWDGNRKPTMASEQISNPTLFLGDRETEPRCLMLARVKHHESDCELILGCTHLTVHRKENEGVTGAKVRQQQVENILKIVAKLPACIPIILAGDFNSTLHSPELCRFSQELTSTSQYCSCNDKKNGTHIEKKIFIDHIWFRPTISFEVVKCYLIDDKKLRYKTEEGAIKYATDHRPVVAHLKLKS